MDDHAELFFIGESMEKMGELDRCKGEEAVGKAKFFYAGTTALGQRFDKHHAGDKAEFGEAAVQEGVGAAESFYAYDFLLRKRKYFVYIQKRIPVWNEVFYLFHKQVY